MHFLWARPFKVWPRQVKLELRTLLDKKISWDKISGRSNVWLVSYPGNKAATSV